MRPFPLICGLLLLASIVETMTGCGIEENGNRQREIVYVTSHSSDVQAESVVSSDTEAEHPSQLPDEVQNESETTTEISEPIEMQVRFGIRDFAQINATMERLTGVPSTTASIRTIYVSDLITQLPTGNDLKAFLASHQVGISKLATEYCDVLMANTALRGALLVGFNFNQPPANALADTPAGNVSSALIDRFLGPQLEFHADRDEIAAEVKGLISELVKTAPTANAAETLNIVKGACTAVLASSSVSTL